jgi:hypothetical protein
MFAKSLIAAAALLAAFLPASGAFAEEKKAVCEFHNHGDLKKDRTGPCTYNANDEEIRIKLANGDVYRFIEERKRKGHYIDQDGNRLDVKGKDSYKRTYRWKNQRLDRDAGRVLSRGMG